MIDRYTDEGFFSRTAGAASLEFANTTGCGASGYLLATKGISKPADRQAIC